MCGLSFIRRPASDRTVLLAFRRGGVGSPQGGVTDATRVAYPEVGDRFVGGVLKLSVFPALIPFEASDRDSVFVVLDRPCLPGGNSRGRDSYGFRVGHWVRAARRWVLQRFAFVVGSGGSSVLIASPSTRGNVSGREIPGAARAPNPEGNDRVISQSLLH